MGGVTFEEVAVQIMPAIPVRVILPPTCSYDAADSAWTLLGLTWRWFFESGPDTYGFDPESSVTQDIMYDPGMLQFYRAWAEAGYPVPWRWRHTTDKREGELWQLPFRLLKGFAVYHREHFVELPLAAVGLGSKTAKGRIDAVGGTIGSLDEITVSDAGGGLALIQVHNTMDWASGTRIPGTNYSLIQSRPRKAWGPGGSIQQRFRWWVLIPN